jgi:hypothetical protein
VDQFVVLLTQKLRQPLELKPDWSASPLVGSLPGVLQRLKRSMVVELRCLTYRLTLRTTQCMLWSAEEALIMKHSVRLRLLPLKVVCVKVV